MHTAVPRSARPSTSPAPRRPRRITPGSQHIDERPERGRGSRSTCAAPQRQEPRCILTLGACVSPLSAARSSPAALALRTALQYSVSHPLRSLPLSHQPANVQENWRGDCRRRLIEKAASFHFLQHNDLASKSGHMNPVSVEGQLHGLRSTLRVSHPPTTEEATSVAGPGAPTTEASVARQAAGLGGPATDATAGQPPARPVGPVASVATHCGLCS